MIIVETPEGGEIGRKLSGDCWGRTCGKPYPTYGGGIGDAGLAE